VHPKLQISVNNPGLHVSSSKNSGACHRSGPTSGFEGVYPVGPFKSSMTLDSPKSLKTARPSSVIRTLFCQVIEKSNQISRVEMEMCAHSFQIAVHNGRFKGMKVF
jgi:hypothetical protein